MKTIVKSGATMTPDMQQERQAVKDTVRQMWREAFDPDEHWLDMYFDRVYNHDDLLILTAGDDDDVIASSLLLQRYTLYFHSSPVPMGYISGAVTRRRYRNRGYMKQLVRDALEEACERGDALVSLIPASRRLSLYYDRLGFSTVFYIDEERYTGVHRFEYSGTYSAVDPLGSHEVYTAVDSMLRRRDNVVLHTYDDFQSILADVTLDGGHTVALRDVNTGDIAAVALAVPSGERIVVRELLSVDSDARQAALDRVSGLYPSCPVSVMAPPDVRSIPVHARGMARIVNARRLLEAYAAHYPGLTQRIRLYDPVLPCNSHIYVLDRGEVVVNDGFGGHIDLDVTPEILLSILCSDTPVGDIFGIPTARPYMSMMMD